MRFICLYNNTNPFQPWYLSLTNSEPRKMIPFNIDCIQFKHKLNNLTHIKKCEIPNKIYKYYSAFILEKNKS